MKLQRMVQSITGRITLFIVCLILPLNLLVLLATGASIDAVQTQMTQSLKESAALYMQQLNEKINGINTYYYNLNNQNLNDQSKQFFTTFLAQQGDDEYRLARSNVIRQAQQNLYFAESADGYFFYAPVLDDFVLVYEGEYASLPLTEVVHNRETLSKLIQGTDWENARGWSIGSTNDQNWLIHYSRRGNFYYGAILSLDALYTGVSTSIPNATARVLLTSGPEPEMDNYIEAWQQSDWNPIWLHIFIHRSEVLRSLPLLQWLAIVLAVVYLLLIPALLFLLNHSLLRPLKRIRQALLRLGNGDQRYSLPENEKNLAKEFLDIHHSFNQMSNRLRTLKIENYEQALRRKDLEVQNLQLQIRPHFLLNTFNLIYNLAQLEDFQSIQKFVLYLTDYFRYLFHNDTGFAFFSQECSLIREYLEVSALRYPDCFTVTFDVDKDTDDIPVPPLLLHNLVENIFKHAMRLERQINIRIAAHKSETEAVFVIQDDGAGIDPETVARINAGDFEDTHNEHVGLRNTCRRLETIYQCKGLMQVISSINQGTQFIIKIPLDNHQGKEHDR